MRIGFVEQELIPETGHRFVDEYTCHDRECMNDGCDYISVKTTEHIFSDYLEGPSGGCSTEPYQ